MNSVILWQRGIRWVLLVSYAGLIFWLSDNPVPDGVPWIDLPGVDRFYHMAEYGLLGLLSLQAFAPQTRRRFFGVLFFCWLYGLSDEIHQAWVPGRGVDVMDWLADGMGIASAGWIWARQWHLS